MSPYRTPAEHHDNQLFCHEKEERCSELRKLPKSRVMRGISLVNIAQLLLAVFTVALASAGCSLFTAQNAQTVLDVAKVICIVANAESSDATVKTVCNITDAEDAALHAVLNEHRTQAKRYAAARCAQDTGPNASYSGDAGVEAGKK